MNPVVVISVIIIVVLIVILIVLITRASIDTQNNNANGSSNTTNQPPCTNTVNTNTLVVIPEDQAPCHQDSLITLYYIGELSQGKWDFVVAPITTSPTNVCASFCSSIQDKTCVGPNYAGKTAQENYNDCLVSLSTTNCVPPAPLAIKGTVLYYPYSPTCRSCDSCQNTI
jgi:hypothetical protein